MPESIDVLVHEYHVYADLAKSNDLMLTSNF